MKSCGAGPCGRPRYSLCVGLLAGVLALLVAPGVQARHHHARESHGGEPGGFDYYVLSLSWAPTYCLTHVDDGEECRGKGYGLVLHGLWPQYEGGGYPADCASHYELTENAAARGRTLYPSERLMRHEWREHGTCSGLDALAYFQTADRATAVMRTPRELSAPRTDQTLRADQIIALVRAANPQLPADALTVSCTRARFSEIRLCLSRELQPRACGRGVHPSCPRVPLYIPASRSASGDR